MFVVLILSLMQPGTHVPPEPKPAAASAVKTPVMQPAARKALATLVERCVSEARTAAGSMEAIGDTAYFLTFDRKGRIADVDFLIEANAKRTVFQRCLSSGMKPWPLVADDGKTLRMGWPSFTTPNPNPPQMPRRPWHIVKTKHGCPATGAVTAPCITANGRQIRAPQSKLADAVALMLQRYHHIEGVTLDGTGATALWRSLRARRVAPNRVDVRERNAPLEVRIHAWRGLRLKAI